MAAEDETQPPPSASHQTADIVEEDGNGSSSYPDSGGDPTVRTQIGRQLSTLTDVVNDNLIIVRYATFSTVFLLGAYGVANTPLFYRYKNLIDIPSELFAKRQTIHGRIVGVLDDSNHVASSGRQSSQSSNLWSDASATSSSFLNKGENNFTQPQQQQRPITILFRHSSPMERLLTQSAMEKILSSSNTSSRNLLPIELAGVVSPPTIASTNHHSASSVLSPALTKSSSMTSSSSQVPELLQSLIEKKAKVSLQMLALRTVSSTKGKDTSTSSTMFETNSMHAAICHLNYRKPSQWLSTTNLGLELVQRGQALVNQDGLVMPPSKDDDNTALIDFNPTVKQLQKDSSFMSELEEAEFAAWKSKEGVWSSSEMRELRKEYAEEQKHLNSSLWSMMKRGFEWIIGRSRK